MQKKPGQFNVYKGSAAAQIGLILPTYKTIQRNDGTEFAVVEKEGGIFIEATPSTGKKDQNGNIIYDWSQKVAFSLGINDICLLMENFEKELLHDYQGKIKKLRFKAGVGQWEGTYTMTVSIKQDDGNFHNVMVPFTGGETRVFSELMKAAVTRILGW